MTKKMVQHKGFNILRKLNICDVSALVFLFYLSLKRTNTKNTLHLCEKRKEICKKNKINKDGWIHNGSLNGLSMTIAKLKFFFLFVGFFVLN